VSYFLITFVFFLIVIGAMAVGYIFQRKTISGSCGGIASLGIEKVCDCPEPCEKRKAREAKAKARAELLDKNRII
jgi:hypothetical protein